MKRTRFFEPVTLLFCAVSLLLSLAINCNNRFWWQIPIASAALWWVPLSIGCSLLQVYRLLRREAPVIPALIGILCVGSAAAGVIQPILALSKPLPVALKESEGNPMFRFALVTGKRKSVSGIKNLIEPLELDGVVLSLSGPYLDELSSFGHRRKFSLNGENLVIASRFPFAEDEILEFGDEALPGALIKVTLSSELTMAVGLLDLLPAVDPYAFHVNRTTLRRVATQFRNMNEAGLLIATLRTPIFSRFYGLLVNYGHLRSVWRDTEYSRDAARMWLEIPFLETQILVNPGIVGVVPEVLRDIDGDEVGTILRVAIRKK